MCKFINYSCIFPLFTDKYSRFLRSHLHRLYPAQLAYRGRPATTIQWRRCCALNNPFTLAAEYSPRLKITCSVHVTIGLINLRNKAPEEDDLQDNENGHLEAGKNAGKAARTQEPDRSGGVVKINVVLGAPKEKHQTKVAEDDAWNLNKTLAMLSLPTTIQTYHWKSGVANNKVQGPVYPEGATPQQGNNHLRGEIVQQNRNRDQHRKSQNQLDPVP